MAINRTLAHGKPCPYCRRPMDRNHPRLMPTREHVVPESKGGRDIIIACYTCNTIKGDMMPDVWAAFMETFPRWWELSKSALRRARRENFFTPGYKPPKRLVANRPPCVVPPELIYSTMAMDAMLPRPEPSEREARRTEKWGPRRSSGTMVCPVMVMVADFFMKQRHGVWTSRQAISAASDQPQRPEPESLP